MRRGHQYVNQVKGTPTQPKGEKLRRRAERIGQRDAPKVVRKGMAKIYATKQPPSGSRDRSLRGKARRKARKEANRRTD